MKHHKIPMSQHRPRPDLNNSLKNRIAVSDRNRKPKEVTLPKCPWAKEEK